MCGRMRLGESTRKRGLAPDGSVVFPAFPLLPHRYRGEQTRSGPALEFNYPKECFTTEKLLVLYHYSLLSLQRYRDHAHAGPLGRALLRRKYEFYSLSLGGGCGWRYAPIVHDNKAVMVRGKCAETSAGDRGGESIADVILIGGPLTRLNAEIFISDIKQQEESCRRMKVRSRLNVRDAGCASPRTIALSSSGFVYRLFPSVFRYRGTEESASLA